MATHELTFTFKNPTKNKYRFMEDVREGQPIIYEQMYIPKALVTGNPELCKPKVTIEL